MSKLILYGRDHRLFVLSIVLFVLAMVLLLIDTAEGAPYANPFWVNSSSSQESAIPSVASLAMSPEGVDVRTGELMWDHFVFRTPGLLRDNVVSLRWRSMLSGVTQVGRQWLPSWETTAAYVVIDEIDPNSAGGHRVDVRRPSGRVDAFTWNGSSYDGPSDVFDTLTTNGSGNYVLTDKRGVALTFDAQGMPDELEDTNGNQWSFTYNVSYQITGMTDDRSRPSDPTTGSTSTLTDRRTSDSVPRPAHRS